MWKTSINLTSVDNGWIGEVVFEYIPNAKDSPELDALYHRCTTVERCIFTERGRAVKWLSERLEELKPVEVEAHA